MKEKHFQHPETGHQVVVLPLPASESLKFFEDLLLDWWHTYGSQQLPLILMPGVFILGGGVRECLEEIG